VSVSVSVQSVTCTPNCRSRVITGSLARGIYLTELSNRLFLPAFLAMPDDSRIVISINAKFPISFVSSSGKGRDVRLSGVSHGTTTAQYGKCKSFVLHNGLKRHHHRGEVHSGTIFGKEGTAPILYHILRYLSHHRKSVRLARR
jgi:hypothetical protein